MNIILVKYSRKKKLCKIGRVKCQWNLHEISTKRTAENVNEMFTKNGFIMSLITEKYVYKIYSEKYLKCVQNVNIFSKREKKGKQEEHKIPTKYKQKLNKMFVNVHRQSTHDVFKNLCILFNKKIVPNTMKS